MRLMGAALDRSLWRFLASSGRFSARMMMTMIVIVSDYNIQNTSPSLMSEVYFINSRSKNKIFEYVQTHMSCNKTKKLLKTLDRIVWQYGFEVRLSYIINISRNIFLPRLRLRLNCALETFSFTIYI